MCPSRLPSVLMVLFSFTIFIPKPWIFDCAGFLDVSNLDSLEVSALEVHLRSFIRASGLRFTTRFPWVSPLLLPVFLLFLSEVFGGSSKVVWGTWGFFPRNLILRIRLNFLGSLPIISGFPCYVVLCSQGFSEVFGWNYLRLKATRQEVLSLPSGVIVSWRRRYHGIFFLYIQRSYFNVRISSYYVRKERLT